MQENEFLSIHEKQLQNIQAKIEQMEKENLETKSWTMQGEVTFDDSLGTLAYSYCEIEV